MSKHQLYQALNKGNASKVMDFLVSKGVWGNPELEINIVVKVTFNGELIDFPLYTNLSDKQISDLLEKFGFEYSEFEEYLNGL